MMMIIMLGMGASMTPRDFLLAFCRPKGILVGLTSQFAMMPLLAFLLATALALPPPLTVGLILIGCMPGGTTSNIFAYFSKGLLALSIMMTTVSTLVAVVMVPLLLSFYGRLAGVSAEYVIPAGNVAQILAVLLVPTALGMLLRKLNPNSGATVELVGALMGVVVILFLIANWVPRNFRLLLETETAIYMLEPKAKKDMEDTNVIAKMEAATRWCERASDHNAKHGGKPWRYALISHEKIKENMTIEGLVGLHNQ
jgi:BASS family bile acid:Na+ symporter